MSDDRKDWELAESRGDFSHLSGVALEKQKAQKANVSKDQMGQLPFIIAVDFDGTLVEDCYPKIGKKIDRVFDEVKRWRTMGMKIVLWTCRDGAYLAEAVEFCRDNGLEFDAVNRNIPEVIEMFNNDTRKVYANVYLDDKAIRPGILEVLHNTDPTSIKPWRSNRT